MTTEENTTHDPDPRPLGSWPRIVDALLAREYTAGFAGEEASRRDWMLLSVLSGDVGALGWDDGMPEPRRTFGHGRGLGGPFSVASDYRDGIGRNRHRGFPSPWGPGHGPNGHGVGGHDNHDHGDGLPHGHGRGDGRRRAERAYERGFEAGFVRGRQARGD